MTSNSKQETGELLAAVSNMVVGVYADCLGRGPTRARSYIDHDVVLCILEDTLTKPERLLRDSGSGLRLMEMRAALQEAMHRALVGGMERLLERQVKALISGTLIDSDVASEVFVLGGKLTDGEPKSGTPVLPDGPGAGLEHQAG